MDEHQLQAVAEETLNGGCARTLSQRRQKMLDVLANQRAHLDQLDTNFSAALVELETRLSANHSADNESLAQQEQSIRARAEQLVRCEADLAADRAQLAAGHAELEQLREQFEQQELELKEKAHLDREQLEKRFAEIDALAATIRRGQQELAEAQQHHQQEIDQLARRRTRLDELEARLEREHADIEQRREQTRAQRHRVAQQLRTEHADLLTEREAFDQEMSRHRAQIRRDRQQLDEEAVVVQEAKQKLEEAVRNQTRLSGENSAEVVEAQHELAAAQQELVRANHELTAAQKEVHAVQKEMAGTQQKLVSTQTQLGETRRERDALTEQVAALGPQLAEAQKAAHQAREGEQQARQQLEEFFRKQDEAGTAELVTAQTQMAELLKQRDAIADHNALVEQQLADAQREVQLQATQLAALQKQLAAAAVAPDNAAANDDTNRRFQMALEDLRELKRRNAELEESLAASKSGRSAAAPGGEKQDWESTKRRMMAQLNAEDSDQAQLLSEDDRMTVEGTIRITDDIVAQREREIAELKHLLAQGQSKFDAAAVESRLEKSHAADNAAAAVLDKEALILAERQRLLDLQNEWREKVRASEVEISVERARIAREHTELSTKLQSVEAALESLSAQQAAGKEASADDTPGKPAHRWLNRMGLKEKK